MEQRGGRLQAPGVRDLTRGEEGAPKGQPRSPADLILVTSGQLEEGLAQIREVDSLPEGGPGIAFFPFGPDMYVGHPFCETVDPQQTCWATFPGPDDNPFTYSCACDTSGSDDEPPTIIDCLLGITAEVGGPLSFFCDNQRCTNCQPVYRRGTPIIYKCECAD
jgi:hypothetical protein